MDDRRIYVLADDGKLYEDALLRGPQAGGWRMDWGQDGKAVLTMRLPAGLPAAAARRRADEALANAGVAARTVSGPSPAHGGRSGFGVEVLAPVPARLIPDGWSRASQPEGECFLHAFGENWG